MIANSATEKLRLTAWGIAGIWLVAQIILMFCHFGPQQGDWGTYIMLAHRCCDTGEWYPMKCDLYSAYIFALGLVNLLIAEFKLFGTLFFNKVFFLILNVGVLINIFLLAKHFFTEIMFYAKTEDPIAILGVMHEDPKDNWNSVQSVIDYY